MSGMSGDGTFTPWQTAMLHYFILTGGKLLMGRTSGNLGSTPLAGARFCLNGRLPTHVANTMALRMYEINIERNAFSAVSSNSTVA